MSVREMLSRIDSAELCEWRAYYAEEPFGELIADQRHGILTSVLANVNRDVKKRPDAYKPTDFIYWHEVHRRKQVPRPDVQLLADPQKQSALVKQTLFGGLLAAAKKAIK